MGKYELYGAQAERMYVQEGKTLEQIKEILQVSLPTLSDWSKKCDWPKKRAEKLKRPQLIEERVRHKLYEKLEALCQVHNEDFGSKEADQISKLVSALGKLEANRDPLRAAVSIMEQFTNFLRRKQPQLIPQLAEIIPAFFEQVREDYVK